MMATRYLFFTIFVFLFLSTQATISLNHAIEAQSASGQANTILGDIAGCVSSSGFIKHIMRLSPCCWQTCC